jgi:nucleoside-diphosphate-sugar epimerase
MLDSKRLAIVTGAGGFIGRHVVGALAQSGWQVFESHFDLLGTTPDYLFPKRATLLIHLAGLAHRIPRDREDGLQFHHVNVEGTGRLLHTLDERETEVEGLLLASSVAVYGRRTGVHLTEETPTEGEDPYGVSKRLAELCAQEWAERRRVPVTVLRLPLVIGANAPGSFGRMVDAIRGGRYLGVGAGSARRSMVLAEDVALLAARHRLDGGVFHLTDGHDPSMAELEASLCGHFGRRPPHRLPMHLAQGAARLGDVGERVLNRSVPFDSRALATMTATLTFDDSRARRALGWKPRAVLDELPRILQAWQ